LNGIVRSERDFMEGWIKLHRQILESEIWTAERFSKGQAWVDLLLLANHKPQTIFIRGIEIKILRGQLAYSQLTLAKRWGWNFKTIVTFLRWLQNRGMLETKTNNQTTIITIQNYSLYQKKGDQSGDQSGDQKETRTETDKNDKNEKKEEEERLLRERFDKFWQAYPRKEAKPDALKAWNTLKADDTLLTLILSAIEKHKQTAQWQKEEGRFISLPAGWLRKRRWEDEIAPPKLYEHPRTRHNRELLERMKAERDAEQQKQLSEGKNERP